MFGGYTGDCAVRGRCPNLHVGLACRSLLAAELIHDLCHPG